MNEMDEDEMDETKKRELVRYISEVYGMQEDQAQLFIEKFSKVINHAIRDKQDVIVSFDKSC